MLEDRGAPPREEGDLIGLHEAMHEENILSSWLREDVEGKAEDKKSGNKPKKKSVPVGRGNLRVKRKGWLWFATALAVFFLQVGVKDFLGRVWRRMWWIFRGMRVSIGVQ